VWILGILPSNGGGGGGCEKIYCSHNGFTWQSIQEAAAAVTEILAIFLQTVRSPFSQENTLRTFIQRRIMHKLERREETAQKVSCKYLYSFYFNFSVENG
jgi:hypothetical protein